MNNTFFILSECMQLEQTPVLLFTQNDASKLTYSYPKPFITLFLFQLLVSDFFFFNFYESN